MTHDTWQNFSPCGVCDDILILLNLRIFREPLFICGVHVLLQESLKQIIWHPPYHFGSKMVVSHGSYGGFFVSAILVHKVNLSYVTTRQNFTAERRVSLWLKWRRVDCSLWRWASKVSRRISSTKVNLSYVTTRDSFSVGGFKTHFFYWIAKV